VNVLAIMTRKNIQYFFFLFLIMFNLLVYANATETTIVVNIDKGNFKAGSDNEIAITLKNTGYYNIFNIECLLTSNEKGIVIEDESYFINTIDKKKSVTYKVLIHVNKNVMSGNYSLSLTVNYRMFGAARDSIVKIPILIEITNELKEVSLEIVCEDEIHIGAFHHVEGSLKDGSEVPLENEIIRFGYQIGDYYEYISTVISARDGLFSLTWIPPSTGEYILVAEWIGYDNIVNIKTEYPIKIIPYYDQYLFSVTSNSTISSFSFNEKRFSFTVSGPINTRGYTQIILSKELVPDLSLLKVVFDGDELHYEAESTLLIWVINFSYQHSSHHVNVYFTEMGRGLSNLVFEEPSRKYLTRYARR